MNGYQDTHSAVVAATNLLAEGKHALKTGGNLRAIKNKIGPAIRALEDCKDPKANSLINKLGELKNKLS